VRNRHRHGHDGVHCPRGAALFPLRAGERDRRHVSWTALLIAFVVSHLAGDLLLQTEWQALTKVRGLGDREGRRALRMHVATYMCAYIPALVWIANDRSVLRAVVVALLVAVPHLAIDDGHLVRHWLRVVKHSEDPAPALSLMVDQSFHVVFLLGAAAVGAA
jgi:hypothetical protein